MRIGVEEKCFPSAIDGTLCHYTVWTPENDIRGAIQLTHGMAEHIGRYDSFAKFLAENGFLVYGPDLPGHGRNISASSPGFFGDTRDWNSLTKDMRVLYKILRDDHPGIPFVLFGHSMGSFLSRSYASAYPEDFDAFVFCGTAGSNPALVAGKLLCKLSILFHGKKHVSKLIDQIAFGPYSKPFAPNRTNFDWLSENTENVDRYVADPWCGFPFTVSAMLSLFEGLSGISKDTWYASVPEKPILLIAGDRDPVGNMGKGVGEVFDRLRKAGKRPEIILYSGMRHEILNETDRTVVFGDVLRFLETTVADGAYSK